MVWGISILIAGGYIHGLYRKKFFHRTEQKERLNERSDVPERDSCIIIYRSFFFSFVPYYYPPPPPFSSTLCVHIHNVSLYPLTTALFIPLSLETQQRHIFNI